MLMFEIVSLVEPQTRPLQAPAVPADLHSKSRVHLTPNRTGNGGLMLPAVVELGRAGLSRPHPNGSRVKMGGGMNICSNSADSPASQWEFPRRKWVSLICFIDDHNHRGSQVTQDLLQPAIGIGDTVISAIDNQPRVRILQ